MPSASSVRAGRAHVEVTLRDRIDQGARRVQARLRSMSTSVAQAGRNLVAVGAMAGAAIVPSLAVYARFEDRLSSVKAKTGATAAELQKVRKVAKDLGRTTSFSAEQVAGAAEFLAQAGRTIQQIPTDLPVMLSIARAGGDDVDLPSAADIVTNVAGAFQIADQLTRVGDVIAQSAAKANVNVAQMGETFKLAGPPAKAAGQDIEEMAAAAGILGNNGIQGTAAGTDLKNVMVALAKNTRIAGVETQNADGSMRDLLDVMQELGEATAGMSEAERLTFFIDKFGKISAKSALILSSAGDEIMRYRDLMGESEGAAKRMADTMDDNLGGAFRGLKSAAEGVQIAIGEATGGMARDWIESVTKAVQASAVLIEQNPELVQTIAKVTTGAAAAGVGLLGLSLGMRVAASAMTPLRGGLSGAFKLLKLTRGAMLATSAAAAGGILAGALGIDAGFSIAEMFMGRGQAAESLQGLLGIGRSVFGGLRDSAGAAFSGIRDAATTSYGAIVTRIQAGDLEGAFAIGMAGMKVAWSEVVFAFAPQWSAVTGTITDTWDAATSLLGDAWRTTTGAIQSVWQSTTGWITGNTGTDDIKVSWIDLQFGLAEIFQRIRYGAASMWEKIKAGGISAIDSLTEQSQKFQDKFLDVHIAIARFHGADTSGFEERLATARQQRDDRRQGERENREQELQNRLDEIERQRIAALEALDEDRIRKKAAKQKAANDAVAAAMADREKAHRELDTLANSSPGAGSIGVGLGAALGLGPLLLELQKGEKSVLSPELKNLLTGQAARTMKLASRGSFGSFSARAITGAAFNSPMRKLEEINEKILTATEKTADNTNPENEGGV